MAISDADISSALSAYLGLYPDEAAPLSEPVQLLSQGGDFSSRRNFRMHVTVGALLVRGDKILLVEHLSYGIVLQPGGHLEPTDTTLIDAAVRELTEETDVDPGRVFPRPNHRPLSTSSTAWSRLDRTKMNRITTTLTSATAS
ncbi:NUDIX domain-containing protein [Nonomuraea cypriaca]|uniref:NUDIX domain-containing protein n=1 Tax=Nonomuraea cypriaca TaxID=1187855 RepID=UPI002E2D28EC|nr:NUDIX domain-containing protein [Nonomuraea cypriaca]